MTQDPSPLVIMAEQDALLVVLETVQEPYASMTKQVSLSVALGAMHVPSALRTKQEPLPVLVRALLRHGVDPAVRRALPR